MPKVSTDYVPKYRLHRRSGQARVTIDGHDYYLGPWKSRASLAEYDRLINEWLAGGRRLSTPDSAPSLTVAEVIVAYRRFAKTYYVRDGKPTEAFHHVRRALKVVRRLYGKTPAVEFGPKRLKAVRQVFINDKLTRGYINSHIGRIKRMFKWAAEEELVPGGVFQSLSAVSGLRRGRSAAPDRAPVEPVADEVIQATLPHLPPTVGDMVRLARLTGMRPSEVCILRPCDLDTSGPTWLYHPSTHKTEHHGRSRVVYIGPKGQDILKPYLLRGADDYCFCPKDSERRRRAELHSQRKTPMCCGNRPGTNRRARPKRKAGDHYTKDSFNRAIARAVRQANKDRAENGLDPIPHWSANRLRHTAATDIRRQYGLEAAQVMLGHAKADVTQVYAEADIQKGAAIAAQIGLNTPRAARGHPKADSLSVAARFFQASRKVRDMNEHSLLGASFDTPDSIDNLAYMCSRLARAIRQSAAHPKSGWQIAVIDLAMEIETCRNPRQLPVADMRRGMFGTIGFDRLAAIEKACLLHDELIRVLPWDTVVQELAVDMTDYELLIPAGLADDLDDAAGVLRELAIEWYHHPTQARPLNDWQQAIINELKREQPQSKVELMNNLGCGSETLYGKEGKGGLSELVNWGEVAHCRANGGYSLSQIKRT